VPSTPRPRAAARPARALAASVTGVVGAALAASVAPPTTARAQDLTFTYRTNPELAAQMAEYERGYGDRLTLRSVTVPRSTDGKGRVVLDTPRGEVTEMSRGRLDPALIQLPAGVEIADVGQTAAAPDTSRRAGDASAEATSDEANAQGAVRNAVGGMLRRSRP
jgi:hypothetical protein